MNNKGMAISSILYIILVLFIALLYGVLGLITATQQSFNKVKGEVEYSLNNDVAKFNIPTIGYSISEDTAKIYFVDNKLVSYYAILESDIYPNEWIDIEPSPRYELEYTLTPGKTYYVYVRDDEGNISNISFEY